MILSGADIDKTSKHGETPLSRACENDYFEIAKLLIENGAHFYQVDSDGDTPLSIISGKTTEVIKAIIITCLETYIRNKKLSPDDRNKKIYGSGIAKFDGFFGAKMDAAAKCEAAQVLIDCINGGNNLETLKAHVSAYWGGFGKELPSLYKLCEQQNFFQDEAVLNNNLQSVIKK